MAAFTITETERLADIRRSRLFRSPAWLATAAGFTILALACFLGLLVWGSQAAGAVSFILGGLAALLWLPPVYFVTTLPYQSPRAAVPQLIAGGSGNLLAACDYSVLEAIEPYLAQLPSEEVKACLEAVVSHRDIEEMLYRLELSPEEVRSQILQQMIPVLPQAEFVALVLQSVTNRAGRFVRLADLVQAFLVHPKMQTYLRRYGLRETDVDVMVQRYHDRFQAAKEIRQWWRPQELLGFSGIGLEWASGFTPFVDRFARIPAGNIWDTIDGHEAQMNQLLTALSRARQSNVLLVGENGAGVFGLIRELHDRLRRDEAHPAINKDRLLYINIAQIAAMGSSPAEQMSILSRALNEMERAGNITAVFAGLGSVLGQAGEGKANFSEILIPFLSSASIRTVVILSPDDYHDRMKQNQDLLDMFEVVEVPPLDPEATLRLLVRRMAAWEVRYGVLVSYQTLREIVDRTESIMPYVPFPEKAFDLLENAISQAQLKGQQIIRAADIQDIISQQVGINVGSISAKESDRLLNLEDIMHEKVINQNQGITALAKAMLRARTNTRQSERPIGTFLFLGPTGVGKTQTAKALAYAYFGSEEYMQRLDMTQFRGEDGIARLIGSANRRTGILTSLITDHPFTVLLLDEFEKADDLVKQLFMPIFDEGYVTDAQGRKYSFTNTIVIATSNAGAEMIRAEIADDHQIPADFEERLREHVLQSGIFRPEVLNRFDDVITFLPLTRDHLKQIAGLMLRQLNARLDREQGITLTISDDLLEFLADIGFDPEFGARPMTRAIQDTVEYAIARQIAQGTIAPGQAVQPDINYLRQLV